MPVNLSIKNVPDELADRLRRLAAANHRSLQGQLMAILEEAVVGPSARPATVREPSGSPALAPPVGVESLIDELGAVRARTKRGRESLTRLRDAGRRM